MVAFIAFSGKSNTGLPIATLSPTVNVYRLSDFAEVATAVPAVYIDDASDPSLGGYRVSSANTPNVDGEDYYWEADLDPGAVIGLSDSRRYKDGVYSGTTNARIETDIPAIFADVASLDDVKITTARANLLDEITALRLAELDPANLPADIDTLITRLTAARAANLDEITAARLAELDGANMPGDIDALGTGQGVLATAIAGVPAAVDVALSATHGPGGWEGTEQTRPHLGVSYDVGTTTVSLVIHAVRDGIRVVPTAFNLDIVDPTDTSIITLTEGSAGVVLGPDDVYRVQVVQALAVGTIYRATLDVDDASGTIGPRLITIGVST